MKNKAKKDERNRETDTNKSTRAKDNETKDKRK